MASIGALTTTFTAPASCASSTGINIVGCGSGCVWWAEGPLDAPDCYPSSYNPSLSHYYSPGVCPSGYTPACTSKNTAGRVTETVQTCCPTALGYSYRCVQPTWSWQSSLGCTVYFIDATSTFSFPTVTSIRDGQTVITSTARTEVGIGAYGVEIRFQATDFVSSPTSTSSSTTTSTSASTSANPTNTTAADTGSASSSKSAEDSHTTNNSESAGNSASNGASSSGNGLSAAASAGIGVGAALGTLLILAVGIIFGRRSVRRRRQDSDTRLYEADTNAPDQWKHVGGGHGGWYPQTPHELPITEELAELQARDELHEMGG